MVLPIMKPRFSHSCALPLGGILLHLSISLAPAATTLTDEDLLLSRSPVIIKSRVGLGGEHKDLGGGGHHDKLKLSAVYGFGFNDHDRNFGIGVDLPYLWDRSAGGGSGSGVGDFKVRVGQIFTGLPEGWRAGWFFETEFDTAASDVFAIANQRTQMALGGGAIIPMNERLALTTSLSYGWSLDNGTTTGRKAEWEAHFAAAWKIMENLSCSLDYKVTLDTVGGSDWFHTLEPGFGLTLGENMNYGLVGSLELPLSETGTDWVAKLGLIRFF